MGRVRGTGCSPTPTAPRTTGFATPSSPSAVRTVTAQEFAVGSNVLRRACPNRGAPPRCATCSAPTTPAPGDRARRGRLAPCGTTRCCCSPGRAADLLRRRGGPRGGEQPRDAAARCRGTRRSGTTSCSTSIRDLMRRCGGRTPSIHARGAARCLPSPTQTSSEPGRTIDGSRDGVPDRSTAQRANTPSYLPDGKRP